MTADAAGELRSYIELHNQGLLKAYTAHRSLIREHHAIALKTFEDLDGYRVVLQNAAWVP